MKGWTDEDWVNATNDFLESEYVNGLYEKSEQAHHYMYGPQPCFHNMQLMHTFMGYLVGSGKAKAQAVPDTHIAVPKDVAKRIIGHIGIAMCHPNNTRSEEDIMVDDQEFVCRAIEASESGAEG